MHHNSPKIKLSDLYVSQTIKNYQADDAAYLTHYGNYIMNRDQTIKLIRELKRASGSHSPSRAEIIDTIGYDPVKYDFCFLSNPYATDLIVPRIIDQFDQSKLFQLLESYPASGSVVARRIANFEGANASNIVVGNGAVQCIEWVCLGWGIKRLLVPTPTFSTYYEILGTRAHLSSNLAFGTGINAAQILQEADATSSDAILLIHPNNPTGEALETEDLRELVSKLQGKKLIIDESFSHFLSNYASFQDFRNNCDHPDVTFIKSMSKDFGVAGIRLGYMTTTDSELKAYSRLRSTWNLNNLAVEFSKFLVDENFVNDYWMARKKYLSVRDEFAHQLNSISEIQTYASQANFFLIRLPESASSDLVFEMLIDSGVYVRTMEDKIGLTSDYIRVACRRPEENKILIEALKGRLR
jgi:histidinol-phosphate/aromatic aminotransferase/cobyric acid decarboxylase-like protein